MINKINNSRRSFLSQLSDATGPAALSGSTFSFTKISGRRERKKLLATTDYIDNVLINDHFMDTTQLYELNKQLASLGVSRHQWMVNPVWSMYEDYPGGFDLLEEAVKAAHANGLEFYAVVKPFEGGASGNPLPHSFPYRAFTVKDLRGIFPLARPFVAEHPDMCLKRRPGTFEFTGPVSTIRLVKGNDSPTRIKAKHLTVFTSPTNNGFVPYNGPVTFRESVETRFRFPKWRQCRVLHLEDLEIPEDHTYILIKCSLADDNGDFSNENGTILEIENSGGKTIPYILSTGRIKPEDFRKSVYTSGPIAEVTRYIQLPEVQKEIRDSEKMDRHFENYYSFDKYELTDWTTLDKQGFIAASCGKPEHMLGNLHPIYPEVRENWLELVRFCLDRGVDGINFRVANHTRLPDSWEYGFNDPVLEASGGKTDSDTISRINGNAYTQFLREARELIKSRGKGLTIHLHAGMLIPDERGRLPVLPPNFEWQWETWVREIGDEFHFRGAWTLRPWNLNKALDIFSAATKKANKPLYFQSDFHTMTNDEGRRQCKLHEVEFVQNYSGLDGFILYETANYTQMDKNGKIELKPYIGEVLKTYFE
jgi:hypothetical protein